MTLTGEKVILRPLLESDFEKYFNWHSDNEIRFQTSMHPFPVAERLEREWFEKAISDTSNKRFIFSIIYKENNELIGYFQLAEVNFINRNGMLGGVVIGEKNYQGKHLGEEILKLGINYGFVSLGLNKISLDVLQTNSNAIKLYKKNRICKRRGGI